MKLKTSHLDAFIRMGKSEREFGRFVRDLIGLGETLEDYQIQSNATALLGVQRAVDEIKVVMALYGAKDELELEMKSALLIGRPPMLPCCNNLSAMLEAALVADAQRLSPGSLPAELRAKFRS